MKITGDFSKLELGAFFWFQALGLCIKTKPETICSPGGSMPYICNALTLESRVPIPVYDTDCVTRADIAIIGRHIWFLVKTADEGGVAPFEIIEMVCDRSLGHYFIPIKKGIRLQNNVTPVTGIIDTYWQFVSHLPLVPHQINFKPIRAQSGDCSRK